MSFLIFGSVPMWVYIIAFPADAESQWTIFGVAAAMTAITLFLLGATQAYITRGNFVTAGTLMTVNGSLAAAAAYLLSWGLFTLIGNGVDESGCPPPV